MSFIKIQNTFMRKVIIYAHDKLQMYNNMAPSSRSRPHEETQGVKGDVIDLTYPVDNIAKTQSFIMGLADPTTDLFLAEQCQAYTFHESNRVMVSS